MTFDWRSLGVPSRFLQMCFPPSVRDHPGNELVPAFSRAPFLRIDRPIAQEDLMTLLPALSRGLYVQLEPAERLDLEFLRRVVPNIKGLYLAGRPKDYSSMEVLEHASGLETLVANGLTSGADLSALPALNEIHGTGKLALSAMANPAVRRLYIEVSQLPSGTVFNSNLEVLSIRARSNLHLSADGPLKFMRYLVLMTPRAVFLEDIESAADLVALAIRAESVEGIAQLRHLNRLRRLTVGGVKSAPDYEAIAELDLDWFEADPNYLFDASFRALVAAKSGQWIIPKQRATAATTSGTADNLAPFSIRPSGDRFEIVFSDWAAAEGVAESLAIFGVGLDTESFSTLFVGVLAQEGGDVDSIDVDSGGDEVILSVRSPNEAERIAEVLRRVWNDPAAMIRAASMEAGMTSS